MSTLRTWNDHQTLSDDTQFNNPQHYYILPQQNITISDWINLTPSPRHPALRIEVLRLQIWAIKSTQHFTHMSYKQIKDYCFKCPPWWCTDELMRSDEMTTFHSKSIFTLNLLDKPFKHHIDYRTGFKRHILYFL